MATAARRSVDAVPAVGRASRILLALGDGRREATLTELARDLDIHKSTTHNILSTLLRHRFVSREAASRKYRLGPGLAALAGAAADGANLGALAQPHLLRLRRLSGETATLHVREETGSLILASAESPHQLKVTAAPGRHLPPYAGAVAKVLLAFARAAPRLPERLPVYTSKTISTPGAYLRELGRVRAAGVAVDEMEYLPGVRAISAPVFAGPPGAGWAVAALSIVGVAARWPHAEMRRLAAPLLAAARALSSSAQSSSGGSAP